MSDALSSEIESFSAKRTSLRDKLKKRREALGSILSGAAAPLPTTQPEQTDPASTHDRAKTQSEAVKPSIEDRAKAQA